MLSFKKAIFVICTTMTCCLFIIGCWRWLLLGQLHVQGPKELEFQPLSLPSDVAVRPKDCEQTRYNMPTGLTNFSMCLHPKMQADVISEKVRNFGSWEPEHTQILYKCLTEAGRDPTLIDIGANIGTHSLAMAAMNVSVVAIEPNPMNYKRFIDSIIFNNFQSKIKLFLSAVSDTRSYVSMMWKSSDNPGGTHVIRNGRQSNVESKFFASTIQIDDLVSHSSKNAVIKIDIEYHECIAFRKAKKLLSELHVTCILMEWLQQIENQHYDCAVQMISMLYSFGFRVFHFNGSSLDQNNSRNWPLDVVWRH